jgi:hypothetical protein
MKGGRKKARKSKRTRAPRMGMLDTLRWLQPREEGEAAGRRLAGVRTAGRGRRKARSSSRSRRLAATERGRRAREISRGRQAAAAQWLAHGRHTMACASTATTTHGGNGRVPRLASAAYPHRTGAAGPRRGGEYAEASRGTGGLGEERRGTRAVGSCSGPQPGKSAGDSWCSRARPRRRGREQGEREPLVRGGRRRRRVAGWQRPSAPGTAGGHRTRANDDGHVLGRAQVR